MRFVPTVALLPGMVMGRDLVGGRASLMLRKGMQLSEQHISQLLSHGYMGVYISDRVSEDIEIKETISPELFGSTIDAIAKENIGQMVTKSADIVQEIMSQDEVSVGLMDLRGYDDYTYHHSVNVAVFAVVVARKMGLPRKDIENLSQAAIFHDLGKMRIPAEIINKPGKLTDEEFELIKTHPKLSVEVLEHDGSIAAIVKQAIMLHHENENGSGYPLGKSGKDIPVIAKILHAVDVYDALTSKRAYKDPYAPVEAFEYLQGGCDILFNREVVDTMMQVIPAYPPGMDVKLSNGEHAIVVGHTNDALRPKVKLLSTGAILDLSKPICANIVIVASGIMPSDYAAEVESLNENRGKHVEAREKVLVVDDMMLSLMQTKRALEEKFDVEIAKSGVEALGKIGAVKPDLLIVDVDMPNMDGYTFAKHIREKEGNQLPIIFLTSRSERDIVLKCVKLGVQDYIVKPALPVYLLERVLFALRHDRD